LIEQAVAAKVTEKREQEEERLYRAATGLPCTPMWTSTNFVSPAGYEWRLCYDVGLPSDLRRLALMQVRDAVAEFETMAADAGWLAAGALNGASARKLVAAGPAPAGPGGAPPPPPTVSTGLPADVQSGNGGKGRQVMETEFIKITAPKGTPRIEFWRPNRQYPEISWSLGSEAFLTQAAGALTSIGWTAAHFDAVGEQYTAPLRIEWEPSPKNPKWKDILSVTPR